MLRDLSAIFREVFDREKHNIGKVVRNPTRFRHFYNLASIRLHNLYESPNICSLISSREYKGWVKVVKGKGNPITGPGGPIAWAEI
jgi:hypothetical protein